MEGELWKGPPDVGRTPTKEEFVETLETPIEWGIGEFWKVKEGAIDKEDEFEATCIMVDILEIEPMRENHIKMIILNKIMGRLMKRIIHNNRLITRKTWGKIAAK